MVVWLTIEVSDLNKKSLREEFGRRYNDYYSTALFDEKGFTREICSECGRGFWSIEDRDTCGEHEPYTFFKSKPIKTSYVELWKMFSDFFKKNKHVIIDRYPVVSRWRQDLYFTIAGIQDFQRIENGLMNFEYPANPLLVPQICLRFSDIENVGVTGKHFTAFTMANQTSFNWPKEGYWRDKTIELNYKLMTEVLGVEKEELIYHEDVWAMGDFSEFGPSLEFFAHGLEMGNNVFTQFEYSNGKIRELDGKVVDVGWGFERVLWFYTGYNSAFAAVFNGLVEKISKKTELDFDNEIFKKFSRVAGEFDFSEGNEARQKEKALLKELNISEKRSEEEIRPIQAAYSVFDHTRTLLFAIADGGLPSNIGGGYNLRIILRRALNFIEEYKLDISMEEIARLEAAELKEMYPELTKSLDSFDKIVSVEAGRYNKSRENAGKIVEGLLAKTKKINGKELRTLYESYGITPELIQEYATTKKIKIEMPANLYEGMVQGDFVKREKEKKLKIDLPKLPKTVPLYYESLEAEAEILFSHRNYLVLDKTPFYPEGGGQMADHGTIGEGKVKDVQRVGDVIVHIMEQDVGNNKEFRTGLIVKAIVDVDRRRRLMAHHTATHLVNACSREVLGKHVWQEGTTKDYEKARIDISHYEKVSDEQVKEIENRINRYLQEGIKVEVKEMERGEAEKKYGFTIYQGHGTPSKIMRIVTISTRDGKLIDAEACGGTHAVGKESYIGMVKIISATKVHDGVTRLEFVAGPAALAYFQKEDSALSVIGETMNVEKLKSAEAVLASREGYRELYKKLNQYDEVMGKIIAEQLAGEDIIEKKLEKAPRDLLRAVAAAVVEKNKKAMILLTNNAGDVICMCGEAAQKGAIDFVKEKLSAKGFKGGGSKKVAEGKLEK